MSFQIIRMDRKIIQQAEVLLSSSVGYETSMTDELEFYDLKRPENWFAALDENLRPVGFVRGFDQGDWTQGELFVEASQNRATIAKELLLKFIQVSNFTSNHRLRFDIFDFDQELKSCIEGLGLSLKTQTFLYYELEISSFSKFQKSESLKFSPIDVAETLSHLHPVSIQEVEAWMQAQSVRVVLCDNKVAAAAQIFQYGESAEIVRIATNVRFLKKGYAKKLMQDICTELSEKGIQKIFLKVEDTRNPAIKFYENFGFSKLENKTQIWYSIYFS